MKRPKTLVLAIVGLVCVFALDAIAQTGNFLPVPSNVWTSKGALAVAHDINHLTGIAPVASGQVLTSQGTAALPVWSATPSLTSATIGASGTAITQIRVYSQTITPASVAANVCAEQTFNVR